MDFNVPESPHIVAITNQKGGVGKTTTAINLAAALGQRGQKVLLIDLDPQGNASTGLGIDKQQREYTSYDLLAGSADLSRSTVPTSVPGVSLVPATEDLTSADMELSSSDGRLSLLRNALRDSADFDTVLLDCPPALGLLTLNAMVAADGVLVPLQAEFLALEGLSQLLQTVRQVRQTANPSLRIEGILLTMSDSRLNLSEQVEADARATLGELVFDTVIPRNIRVSESPSHGLPVLIYDPNSRGSTAYRALCDEYLARRAQAERMADA
ncbi:ParA family protein [Paracoccus pacificus]|uniref:ParA family protein n=1 Tax=Paracoccus pacificus TaxID=1463598 RepID=A0ABW4R2S7_9RHOB